MQSLVSMDGCHVGPDGQSLYFRSVRGAALFLINSKQVLFSIFIYFLVILFFCHINILLLSSCQSMCFIHINKFSKCNKNEHL